MALTRRTFLRGAAASSAAILMPTALGACGDDDAESPPPSSSSPSTATIAVTTTPSASATARRTGSKGELRVAEPFLPATLDIDSGTASSNLQSLGVSETLMRYTPDLKVEPWLASKVERVDALTWSVTLRDDITFSDGTKVDAEAVKTSFLRTMEKQPGTADLLPKESMLTAEGLTLTIKTPVPVGQMPRNLAAANFGIKKVAADGSFIFTGPFQVTSFTARESIELSAYQGYRGGPANLKAIKGRQVADVNARSLAVQAGDIDVAQALLPSDVGKLKSAGVQVYSAPWARQHMLILNNTRAPFDDAAVRRAVALGIDREALLKGVLDGAGSVALGIAPEDIGLAGVVRTQRYDQAEARRLLDAAGWGAAANGMREKDGKKLAFKLGTYSGRAELEQFAVVIIDMMKAIGIEVSIEKFPDVEVAIAANNFEATTYSIGSAAFGDLGRLLATLYTPSPRNKDRYSNPQVNTLFQEFLTVSDETRGQSLLKQMQDLIGQDVPIVHLINPYQVIGYAKNLKNYSPHPLDSYKYTADMSLDA